MKTYKPVDEGFVCEHALGNAGDRRACDAPAEYQLSDINDADFGSWSHLPPGDRFLCAEHLPLHGGVEESPPPMSDQELLLVYLEEAAKA